jgi:hypothetical protein
VVAFVETLHNMYRFDLPESSRAIFPNIPQVGRLHPRWPEEQAARRVP